MKFNISPERIIALNSFLKQFFHLLYNQFAWAYDGVANIVSVGEWKDWVFSVENQIVGNKILELGHGPGHLQKRLSKKNLSIFGLDNSNFMGGIAQRRMKASNLVPHLINADASNIPFCSSIFNHVIATFPTEYISSPNTLREVHRILQPDGTLIIVPIALITGKSIIHRFAAWLFYFTGQAPNPNDLKYFQHAFNPGEIFDIEIMEQSHKYSKAIIMIARKKNLQLW